MNTVTVRDLERTECAVLMAYSTLASLTSKGFIQGGRFRISDQGEQTCADLRAAGFEFNPGELEDVVAWIFSGGEQHVAGTAP